jgi:hypothetical protein
MTVQYLKHYYVSYENKTIALTDTNTVAGGKMHPEIDGLDVQIQLSDSNNIDYCLSVAPVESSVIDIAGVTVLSEVEWKNEWEYGFHSIRDRMIGSIYLSYKERFASLPDDYYHPYEMLYSNYIKRVEAGLITAEMTEAEAALVAPVLAIEASERGIDVRLLASKVLSHAAVFDGAQARLLAERGKEVDILSEKVCDTTSVETIRESINSLYVMPE